MSNEEEKDGVCRNINFPNYAILRYILLGTTVKNYLLTGPGLTLTLILLLHYCTIPFTINMDPFLIHLEVYYSSGMLDITEYKKIEISFIRYS